MSLVQHAGVSTGAASGSTSLTATLGASTTPGNCLIVCLSAIIEATGNAPTVSSLHLGGSADNFAVAKNSSSASAGLVSIYTDQNLQVSSTSVALVVSAASAINLDVYEWSQIRTSGAVDKTNAGTTSSSAAFSSGSTGTLTQASEVVFGMTAVLSTGADTITGPSSPWVNSGQLSTNDPVAGFPYDQLSGYQLVSATTALTYNGSNVSGSFTNAAIVSLELIPPPPLHVKPVFQAVRRAATW